MSNISFSEDAWEDYLYWQLQDKKTLKKINELLKEVIWQCGGNIKDVFGKGWDEEDTLCLETHNQNLLAWFSFEETARILADRNNIEV